MMTPPGEPQGITAVTEPGFYLGGRPFITKCTMCTNVVAKVGTALDLTPRDAAGQMGGTSQRLRNRHPIRPTATWGGVTVSRRLLCSTITRRELFNFEVTG